MVDYRSYRIAGYIATILLHVSNMVYMAVGVRHLKQDPELKHFLQYQPRYFTCWNFGIQVIYAAISLLCEVLEIWNSSNKGYKLNKHLRRLRDTLFAGVLWPSTMLVFSVFWSLYLLDRQLIFPEFADRALTPLSNHVIHTLIVPVVLWEIVFQPRTPPSSHKSNINHLLVHLSLYFSVLVYTYKTGGLWLYPIFDKLFGTIYFPVAILSIPVMCVGFYHLQWVITGMVWGQTPSTKTK